MQGLIDLSVDTIAFIEGAVDGAADLEPSPRRSVESAKERARASLIEIGDTLDQIRELEG
ncbi:hypothetical protein [Microbacterium sp. gxy059]|uniref:hypothetical protein n=1 Tax=Microbacterium sp. gxy059 TaxID=2957199 RepID=UPI003D969093